MRRDHAKRSARGSTRKIGGGSRTTAKPTLAFLEQASSADWAPWRLESEVRKVHAKRGGGRPRTPAVIKAVAHLTCSFASFQEALGAEPITTASGPEVAESLRRLEHVIAILQALRVELAGGGTP